MAANDALQLSRVETPIGTIFVHIVFEKYEWFSSEQIKIFSASFGIDEDFNPVTARFVRGSALLISRWGLSGRVLELKTP
jgi:hypothetical protein